MDEGYRLDRPQALSCPECGGTLSTDNVGIFEQYRCHIGHVFSAESLLAAQFADLEVRLGACMAGLNERTELCRRMAEKVQAEGGDAGRFKAAAEEARARANVIRELLQSEWVQPVR